MLKTESAASVQCYHCGDTCESEQLIFDEHHFCCHGCQAVYELIQQSDLQQYYASGELKAGKVEDQSVIERKFAYLENVEVANRLYRFHDEKQSVVKLYLPGIHCSSCIYLLEHLPKLDPRILRAEVNFIKKEIAVSFLNDMSLKEVAIMLATLGYPPLINLESVDQSKAKKQSNGLGMKIAVAGFCFGNSMLISLPEYLDAGFQVEETFKALFGWLNLALALPVFFYAAQDYFKSAWAGITHKYLNIDVPISLGILTLFGRSAYEIVMSAGPGYVDSLNGLVFFLLIGKWYQNKSYQALSFERDYKSYFPVSVLIVKDGKESYVMLQDLRPGDEIVVHNLELIPADAIITEGEANIDYSFVTGEAEPISKRAGEKVFAGGRQVGGQLHLMLEKAVDNSELTQIWNDGNQQSDRKYENLIDKVSQYFTVIILVLAVGSGVYWYFANPVIMWDVVAAVLIVACPCALALALPFGLGHGMRILGRQGIYLKNASVIERIADIKELVFDKTGTLTKNNSDGIKFVGSPLTLEYQQIIKTACANSAHPLSKLLAKQFDDSVQKLPIDKFHEEIGKGLVACINGYEVKIGSASFIGVDEEHTSLSSKVYLALGDQYVGYFKINSGYRSGVFESLDSLRKKFKLHLLSGDNTSEKTNLEPYFDQLHFQQKPVDKFNYVNELSTNSLMIGDGLNDAGALKSATVGFAVCEDVHQFSPACDALIDADSIVKLDPVMQFSKMVMKVVIAAFIISFGYNVVGLSFAITGNLTPVVSAILMPLSSVTVVGFITLAVSLFGKLKFKKD
ncbi:heavy metal translocating P-type ATPase [Marinoscillum pacificum]|uniref:heavy metal translocating P-type ATPase n=1 Tax=Marinoscillum pacificum TaxID=392723 RepID=UPI0021573E67|nr:heavy metal translocating P-type ATPase metal-binding domain-containing protein [Marinoscillum pacificum]